MGGVNFYLKKPQPSKNPTAALLQRNSKTKNDAKHLIFLQFKYNGTRLVYSFDQKINPKNWNPDKQRVKSNNQTTADGKHLLNDLLNNLESVCKGAYNNMIKNGIPTPAMLRKYLVDFMNQNDETDQDKPTLFKLLERFINGEIKHMGRNKTPNTTKTYVALKGHLLEFQTIKKEKVDFDTITLDFYYRYVDYLGDRNRYEKQILEIRSKLKNNKIKNLSNNSISKDIQILKVILNEAVDLGYTTNLQFRHKKFAVSRIPTDAVYLTVEEILRLYQFDFSNNKRLQEVRDLFVFGCWTGLRYSDFSDIKQENIVKSENSTYIKRITTKTKELVLVPCNQIIMDIFKRYESNHNKLPKSTSNQRFNLYIKEACRLAGFTEKGRLATNPALELCDCISSHTARRSFATNLYVSGFPSIGIMKITGHKSEKNFLKYIHITKHESAKILDDHIKKNWDHDYLNNLKEALAV